MIVTYEEYLSTPKSLTLEKMQEIHLQIISEISGDTEAEEIYEELMEAAVNYTNFRIKWFLLSREERMNIDSSRSACHNSLIVKYNMLARYLKMNGKEAMWREVLGYEEDDKYNRKAMGDFACYLSFVSGINAR